MIRAEKLLGAVMVAALGFNLVSPVIVQGVIAAKEAGKMDMIAEMGNGAGGMGGMGNMGAYSESTAWEIGCTLGEGAGAQVCGVVARERYNGVLLLDLSEAGQELYLVEVEGEAVPWPFDDFETALSYYYQRASDRG